MRRDGVRAGSQVVVEGRRGDESRNSGGEWRGGTRDTDRRDEGRTYERREQSRGGERNADRRDDGRAYERREQSRGGDRNADAYRDNRNRDSRGSTWRAPESDHRNGGYNRNRGGSSWGNRQAYSTRGRVSHYQRYGGGYRVWVVGAPYPFYVPLAYWSPSRFRIGLTIGIGGYYNPGGYYDYWDGYRDGYYTNRDYHGYSRADFAGEVESVDYRGQSFVVRNEETGNFITVVLRDRNEPFPRPGDYVEVRGDWTTRGYFRAYDVELLDGRYDRYRDRYDDRY